MKKTIITVAGGTLVLMGLIFIVVPGPSILLLLPGLAILSIEYSFARVWLKKVQKYMRRAAQAIDKHMLSRKYSK